VKFTAEGEVRVSIDRCDGDVLIRVSDTGIGISAEQAGRLFEPFVQADSSTTRKFGGTGLGLAICKELCSAMGGAIDVVSQSGGLTTFEVRLPLEFLLGATEAQRRSLDAAESPPISEGFRILAAEDNPINQLVLKTLLAQFDLTVTVVDDGLKAVEAWRTGDWDLILMDVQMPLMDGPSATRRIRELEAESGRKAAPIVALTANAMVHQVASYMAAGMNDVIAKPIDIRELLRVIQAVANAASYDEATLALRSSRTA
jgi:CheY-like chemotaxis protein